MANADVWHFSVYKLKKWNGFLSEFPKINMHLYAFVLFLIVSYTLIIESSSNCVQPAKFYVECDSNQTISQATATCLKYGMVVLNLTNSSSLPTDISLLNGTLRSLNCYSPFWFSSGNRTGYVATVDMLGGLLSNLLSAVGALLDGVLRSLLGSFIPCIPLLCSATTTPPPITHAVIICTRSTQQRVIRKCQIPSRTDMRTFNFFEEAIYGGILYSFESRSRSSCSTRCLTENACVGISFINNICTLYM